MTIVPAVAVEGLGWISVKGGARVRYAGQMVVTEDHQSFRLAPATQVLGPHAAAKQICMTLSSFKNGCGQTIAGRGANGLRGPWLERTLKIARQVHTQLPGTGNTPAGG